MFQDFEKILKNTVEWLGIFSFLAILSLFVNFNFCYYMILILLFSEIYILFAPKNMKKIKIISNIFLNFITGVLVFGFFFFIVLDSINEETNGLKLVIFYMIYEVIKLSREYFYLKGFFPQKYYKKNKLNKGLI
jgi:hypothetical protein